MAISKLTVVPTGIEGLDTLMGGGLPHASLFMVVGALGTGKTLFLQQLCFAWIKRTLQDASANPPQPDNNQAATRGAKVLYFSTLSEPHNKLLQHLSQFEFFDESLLANQLKILSLTNTMQQGLDEVANVILNTVRQEQAELVTLDGLGSLESLQNDQNTISRFLYRLSAQLNALGVTTVITLEHNFDKDTSDRELTLADGILHFSRRLLGSRRLRRAEIVKLRGMNIAEGLHTYDIDTAGLHFYPRLEALSNEQLNFVGAGTQDKRFAVGLPELTKMLGGGIPLTSSTVVAGSAGVGKTTFSLHYLMAGVASGEKGLYIGFYESRQQLEIKAARFGMDLQQSVAAGLVQVLTFNPVELEPDKFAQRVQQAINQQTARYIVIDGMQEVEWACQLQQRGREFINALLTSFKNQGITSLYTYEISKLVGTDLDLSDTNFTPLAENLILLKQVEYHTRLYSIISVLKMRDSIYDRTLREYHITAGLGIEVLAPLESAEGVLSGLARSLENESQK